MIALATFGIIPPIYQQGVRSNFPEYCKKPQAVIFCSYLQASFCQYLSPEVFHRYFLKAKLSVSLQMLPCHSLRLSKLELP